MNVKDSVLEVLQNQKSTYVSGEVLSASLGVSRAAVWKAIKALQGEGFFIDAVRNKGYMLLAAEDSLNEASIRFALPKSLQNLPLHIYDSTDSTNLRAKQLLADGELAVAGGEASKHTSQSASDVTSSKSKTVPLRSLSYSLCEGAVIASQQTAGRGRLGRKFFSPQDGLYMSMVIKPNFDMARATLVTVAAAAAVARAIEEVCGAEAKIKWVNDIYVNNKKVSGILTEAISDFESGQIENIIIGIGVNTSAADFPAELLDIAGAIEGDYSRAALAAKLISNTLDFVRELGDNESFGDAGELSFLDIYRKYDLLAGREIKVYKGAYRQNLTEELGGVNARALGIDAQGGLEIAYEDGTRGTLRTGEVSVRLGE